MYLRFHNTDECINQTQCYLCPLYLGELCLLSHFTESSVQKQKGKNANAYAYIRW